VYPKDYYSTNNPLFDISKVDAPPKPVVQAPPVLTPDLLALKKSALVTVEYIISKTGEVEFPLVVDSTDSRFDLITVEAVAQWKFKPAKKKGKPVNCRVRQVFTYTHN
ncbi:MAG: TonB family protein, partial [Candidatus Didemnitutus sp.]|nr:TonB family protein [Candidatus Didemnitutus sp.]